jgi:hypothetical protein
VVGLILGRNPRGLATGVKARSLGEQGKVTPLAKAPGAQFEIAVDGKPRSYRDRKAVGIEAAEHLKRRHPNSEVVEGPREWERTALAYKADAGPR